MPAHRILFATTLFCALAGSLPAGAQGWPAKAVTLIVPAAPGGPSDVLARVLGDKLRERLGQPFVIENRGGAGGSLGTAAVARAAPDGYTLLLTVDAPIVVNPALNDKLAYDPLKDLQAVAMIGDGGDVVLAVPAASPARTVQELVDAMRKDPAAANYVSSGTGFPSHIVGELFKREAKFDAVHIPAKGAGAAMQEFLSGRMSFNFPPASMAAPTARGGKIRLLAVPAAARNPLLPDVPTFAEIGLPGVTTVHYWISVFAPAGTPRAVVETLNTEIRRVTASADYRPLLERQGLVASALSPAELGERVRKDLAYWRGVVKPLGIRAD